MSLQVWLPLNGNLNNQGLSNVVISGTPSYGEGKIGNGLDFINSQIITISCPNLNNVSKFSVCFWIKGIKDTNDGDWASPIALSTNKTGGTENMSFRFGKDNRASASGYPICMFDNDGYSIVTSNSLSFATSDDWEKWIHVCFTTDGTNVKAYINGVLKSSATNGTNGFLTGTIRLRAARYNGFLNDFRVYDHCLSQMEVKELSKGLVLHYKLNGYGQENLWRNSSCQKDLTGMAQSTVGFTIATKDGYNCAHISGQLNKTGYLAIPDPMLPEAGAWYTISADMCAENIVKGTTNPYIGLYFGGDYLNTDNTGNWYGGSSYSGDGKADNHTFVDTYNNDGWHRVSCTVQYLHGGSEYKKGAFRMGYVYARDFTGDLYVKNIKFEKGKISTPWCPYSSDNEYSVLGFDTKIELDCSGFGYNSIFNQSFTVNSNSGGRYVTSIFFGAYNTPKTELITTSFLSSLTNCTISWWEYCTSSGNTLLFTGDTTSKYIAAGSTTIRLYDQQIGTSGITMYKDGVEVSTTQGSTVYHPNVFHTLNEWHHFVMTGVNLSEWTQFHINSYSSGWPLNAYISDLRIYATVLSADDVLKLYNIAAYIDSEGNMYGYEVIE